MAAARRFLDQLPVSSADRLRIAHVNAQRLFLLVNEVARFAQAKIRETPAKLLSKIFYRRWYADFAADQHSYFSAESS